MIIMAQGICVSQIINESNRLRVRLGISNNPRFLPEATQKCFILVTSAFCLSSASDPVLIDAQTLDRNLGPHLTFKIPQDDLRCTDG